MKFFLLRNIFTTDGIVTWFADYHAAVLVFFGIIFRKPVIIIAGGQEAICYPELKKGVYLKKMRGRMVKFALRHASHIIPNHKSLIWHENYFYSPDGKKDGIKYYIPDIHTRMTIVHNGIDTGKFFRDENIEKDQKMVLTVGTMNSVYDFINKGFDLFIKVAEGNPDLHFVMTGIKKKFLPWIEQNHPFSHIPNLEVIYSFCPDEVLFTYYNKAKVFVQVSITEGMPNTLCEAMLCSCIPVGSNVNGIPDAIGNTGIIINERKTAVLEDAVRKALLMNSGESARQRILENFTFEKREKELIDVIEREI